MNVPPGQPAAADQGEGIDKRRERLGVPGRLADRQRVVREQLVDLADLARRRMWTAGSDERSNYCLLELGVDRLQFLGLGRQYLSINN